MAKILVVEDDSDVRNNLIDLLEAEHFTVRYATNGAHALEELNEFFPDLIICDVMMPGMNGHELLGSLSASPDHATIPFVFLTAKADPIDHRDGMNLGADDYLTKPFTREHMLAAIHARLNKSDMIDQKYESEFDELRNNIAVSLPHELRTPLTGIMGFSEYLLDNIDETSKDELKEYLTYIYESGKRLNRLVENYIAFTELKLKQIGKDNGLTPITKTLSVLEFLVQVAQNTAYEYDRGDDLDVQIDDVNIRISEKDFEKICFEIIDNAFRFSNKGQKVHVSARQKGDVLVIEVRDHGIGINPANLGRLGGFVQVARQKNEQQGAGLGLTIARQLISLLRGDFAMDSNEKFGTTVTITLPLN
jgi:signal transduction histidine kinase